MSPGPMEVPFLDLSALHEPLREELDAAARRVVASGRYVLGEELEAFEHEFAGYCGASECIGVSNGPDALRLVLEGYGIDPGDEVVVPSFTFIASWLSVYSELADASLPIADQLAGEVLSLPMGPHLGDEQVEHTISAVTDAA